MATLKNPKYNGNGGLWKVHNNPKIAGQGNMQIGGRVIALTLWHNNRGGGAPDFNLTVNEQKTAHDDVVWFRSLQPSPIVGAKITHAFVDDLTPDKDDDIPF